MDSTMLSPAELATMPDAPARAPHPQPAIPAPGMLRRRHLLDVDDFTAGELTTVLDTAAVMKEILRRPVRKVPALQGKTVINLFYENSTRTRTSFELAAKNLSADVVNFTVATSSVAKGESLIDTVRTLQALGADYVVIRHSQSGAPYLVARHITGSVINAGDGWHAHPSQALLDLFTIREQLGDVSGRTVTIVGDILHSRVARSNMWALTTMGARVVLCGPPTLMPPEITTLFRGRPVRVEHRLERALAGADVVMALRLQRERQQSGLLPSLREYTALYGLTNERLDRWCPHALVMHPGPMNEGVEIAPDVAHGVRSVIETQVTNGLAVRMAILYLLAHGAACGRA